jgi:hypothetical protein
MRLSTLHELSWRDGVIVLVAGVGFAAALSLAALGAGGGGDAVSADDHTGSIATDGRAPASVAGSRRIGQAGLPLSDEQRGHIFDVVMRIPDMPVADAPAPEIADALPGGVPLQDLPAGVTRDIPLVQGHKFVKFDDRILVVEPASRLVVAMIPRYKLLP